MYSFLFLALFLVQFSERHARSPPEISIPLPQDVTECPFDVNMEGFDMDKMLGYWYITYKTSTIPEALRTADVTHVGCQVFKVIKNDDKYQLEYSILEEFINTHEKYLILPENTRANSTRDDKKIMFAVRRTDYDNNAAVITCEQLNRNSHRLGYILSRTKHSDPDFVEHVKGRQTHYDFDPTALEPVPQENCRSVE